MAIPFGVVDIVKNAVIITRITLIKKIVVTMLSIVIVLHAKITH